MPVYGKRSDPCCSNIFLEIAVAEKGDINREGIEECERERERGGGDLQEVLRQGHRQL